MTDIGASFAVQQSNGMWLDLNDHLNYYVGRNSFETYAQTWRRVMVTSPYMEGSYQVHAVPENGNEMVTIHCVGSTYADVVSNAQVIVAAFSQPSYSVARTIESTTQVWSCYTADYSVRVSSPMVSAKMLIVELSIPRLPTYTTNITPAMTTVDGGVPSSTYTSLIQGSGV